MRLALTLPCLLGAATLAAQEAPEYAWIQALAAQVRQENAACVKNGQAYGLAGGSWFSPRWGWEANYLGGRFESTTGLWKANEQHLDGSLLFRPFTATTRWMPFLRVGLGATRMDSPLSLAGGSTTRLNLQAGMGTHLLLGEGTLGSLELRSTSIQSTTRRQEVSGLLGFGYRWGAPAPAPKPAPRPAPLAPPPPPVPAPTPEPAPAPAPAPVAPPAPEPAAPAPVPASAPLPEKIVLGEAVLHFPNNGDALGSEAVKAIQDVAARLAAYKGEFSLVVTGHTSSLGPKAHNRALSLRRAQAVAKVLAGAGIAESRITSVGKGPDQPVAENRTREGQATNRRVEIEVKADQAVERTRTTTSTVDAQAPERYRTGAARLLHSPKLAPRTRK